MQCLSCQPIVSSSAITTSRLPPPPSSPAEGFVSKQRHRRKQSQQREVLSTLRHQIYRLTLLCLPPSRTLKEATLFLPKAWAQTPSSDLRTLELSLILSLFYISNPQLLTGCLLAICRSIPFLHILETWPGFHSPPLLTRSSLPPVPTVLFLPEPHSPQPPAHLQLLPIDGAPRCTPLTLIPSLRSKPTYPTAHLSSLRGHL